jgi:hypothetical protein
MKTMMEELRTSEEDVHVSKEDMETLVEVLACISVVLRSGDLHFNGKGKHNETYACFCDSMARKFANIKIESEQ